MGVDHALPAKVPVRLSSALAAVTSSSARHDLLIEGIPFLLWPSEDDPYVRDFQQDQKDQFDSSGEAGENSFGQWWLRSQSTFHGGAGQKFLDSTGSQVQRQRFYESNKLETHTPGELTVASWFSTPAPPPSDVFGIEQVVWSSITKLVYVFTGTNQLTVRTTAANLPLDQDVTVGVGSIQAITSDGSRVFVAVGDAIYRVDGGSPATVTQTHNNLSFSAGPVKLGFAKDRLICTIGPKVYELAPAPGAPVDMTAVAPHHTVQASGWQFTAIADGPNGIYLAGYTGPTSQLLSMTVTDTAGALDLGPPVVQLSMPPAEIIRDVFFYVNSYFVLATDSGARVGSFTPYGQPQMGPLCITEEACYALTGSKEQVWVGADSGIWRIDLSTPIDDSGRYSHAFVDGNFVPSSEYVNSITVIPGTLEKAYGSVTDGSMFYTADNYILPGTLTTSWIRFDTVEPKQLHYVRVDGDFPKITGVTNVCTVKVETDNGESQTFSISGGRSSYEFSTASLAPAQLFRLTFTLTDNAAGGNGLALRSYQLKALPAPRLFAEHIVPVACFDKEKDRFGKEIGYKGYAADRIAALEAIVEDGLRVTVEDCLTGESFQAVIKRFQYRQTAKLARDGCLGGMVSLVLRKV